MDSYWHVPNSCLSGIKSASFIILRLEQISSPLVLVGYPWSADKSGSWICYQNLMELTNLRRFSGIVKRSVFISI